MGSKATGRMKRQEIETSLPPHYYYHYCSECWWFHKEYFEPEGYYRNYCGKKLRTVLPDNRACSYFTQHPHFFFVPQGRVPTRPFVWKRGRCHWCGREFPYKAYEQNYVIFLQKAAQTQVQTLLEKTRLAVQRLLVRDFLGRATRNGTYFNYGDNNPDADCLFQSGQILGEILLPIRCR
jgi:hypothetical protein